MSYKFNTYRAAIDQYMGDQQPMKRAQRPALDAAGAARGAARDAARGGSDWTAAHGCSTPGGQQRWHGSVKLMGYSSSPQAS